MGVPRSTFYGWLEQAALKGIRSQVITPDAEAQVAKLRIKYEDRIRDLESMVRTYSRDELTMKGVRQHIFELKDAEPPQPDWTLSARGVRPSKGPGVPTLQLSDFHWGEVVNPVVVSGLNEYNTDIAKARLHTVVDKAIDLGLNHMVTPKYPGMVVILGGDMVSGDIHMDLALTNEDSTIPIVLDLFGELIMALTKLADAYGRIHVICNYGNHGRSTQKPVYKEAAATNFDWLLYQILEKHFKVLKDDRVTFQIPYGADALYRIYDTTYCATHGDRLGVRGGDGMIGILGPVARGIKKLKAQYQAAGENIDYVVMGHFHNRLHLDKPGGIVNNALKGYDEFAQGLRLDPSIPSQNMWWTDQKHGITFASEIWAEEPDDLPTVSNWLSIR